MTPRFFALVGPTAAGKTALAVNAIERAQVPAEIVVLDSRQLYRGLDVGTGKPDADERRRVRHHLLDCIGPEETPDAMDYRRRVEEVARDLFARDALPVLVGGAGFYLRALREGFHDLDYDAAELAELRERHAALDDEELRRELEEADPDAAARLHPNDRYRIGRALEICRLSGRTATELEAEFRPRPVLGASFEIVLLEPSRETLHARLERRTRRWLREGWPEEVRGLLDAGLTEDAPGLQILGYRQVLDLVRGEVDEAACAERIDVATRRYARAQSTWFRKESPALSLADAGEGAETALVGRLRALGPS